MKVRQPRTRLDTLLVKRGLAASLPKAQAMILAGEVFVNGVRTSKSGTAIASDGRVTIAEGELLRAISDSLGCPMPPFLPGQRAVAVAEGQSTGTPLRRAGSL